MANVFTPVIQRQPNTKKLSKKYLSGNNFTDFVMIYGKLFPDMYMNTTVLYRFYLCLLNKVALVDLDNQCDPKHTCRKQTYLKILTLISLPSFLWDIGKQYSPRCDATECHVPSGAILFAYKIFIEK